MNDIHPSHDIFHVLYIAADFVGVHQSLRQTMIEAGKVKTTVYIPLNFRWRNRTYPPYLPDGSRVFFSSVVGKFGSFFYKHKIKRMVDYIIRQDIDWQQIDLIHATTWCVEGAVAYELSKRYSIPYILAVRNTDVNTYYKYLFYHRKYFRNILLRANYVTFVSPKYQERTLSMLSCQYVIDSLKTKNEVIYNGINPFFLKNRYRREELQHEGISLLYVGVIDKNKNILGIINAVSILRKDGIPASLTIVGKGKRGEDANCLSQIEHIAEHNDWITLLPEQSKENLLSLYRQHDAFVMCSFHETFGLVYVEALSQGLPVLYSKGEGFDGIFSDGEVGYRADPRSPSDMVAKLRLLIAHYDEIVERIASLTLHQFDWQQIAQRYIDVYGNILK